MLLRYSFLQPQELISTRFKRAGKSSVITGTNKTFEIFQPYLTRDDEHCHRRCERHNTMVTICLFSVRNIIGLLRHEQASLTRLRFERYFSHNQAKRKKILPVVDIACLLVCQFIGALAILHSRSNN